MGAQLPDRSILIKAQFFALDMATERGTSNETEATHLRACDMHNWQWEETYTPSILPRSRFPQNAMHSPTT